MGLAEIKVIGHAKGFGALFAKAKAKTEIKD